MGNSIVFEGVPVNLPKGVVLHDSLGDLQTSNANPILVCGSHCGGSKALAAQVRRCHVQAVFLNNAGVGKNQTGIQGLAHYESQGILACAVSHLSAEIGVARDTWECGIITHANTLAKDSGIQIGDSVQQAVAKIVNTIVYNTQTLPSDSENTPPESSDPNGLKQQTQVLVHGVAVTLADSITFLNQSHAGHIVVCGSHGGVSAGHYAQKHGVKAVFFNDAGIGKNHAGTQSLDSLAKAGILACTVDCNSAEIFNGQDTLENGVISVGNALAKSKGIHEKMTVQAAIPLI